MDKLKEFDAKQFVEKFIEESVGDFIAFEELALAAYTYGVEQALATLEQPGNDPEYLTALESGLDNETQEQFIERTGIVQPPSVRPVTGYGYGYGYGDGYGSGDGYGCGDGYGYGSGSGDGSGYGYGSKEAIQCFLPLLSPAQNARARQLVKEGAVLAYWKSDQSGKPCNGGSADPVSMGIVQKTDGPLILCARGTLHATFEPSKWKGARLWLVAMIGKTVMDDDKIGALEREIVAELTEFVKL